MFTLRRLFVLAGLAVLLAAPAAEAQTRRALVIGINTYRPRTEEVITASSSSSGRGAWINLEGSVNDARAVAELLKSRYRFDQIRLLLDGEATRAGIVAAIRKELIEEAKPGDIAVFYYAGHGSQVHNSLSKEPDKQDETMVPADAALGQPDLRDKEVAKLLAEAAKKGVRLTWILDSCHSGSMSRGLSRFTRARAMAPDPTRDARDAEEPPSLNRLGVLTLSAAQDFQTAAEGTDDQNVPHGAFTAAFLSVLRTSPPDASAELVFARTRALMKASGGSQEPAMDANEDRAVAPLFGPALRGDQGKAVVVVKSVDEDRIVLQGGSAIGLTRGTTLVRKAPPARLEITEVVDVGESVARLVLPRGAKPPEVKVGDAFQVDRWAVGAEAAVQVYLGPTLPHAQVAAAAAALAPLREATQVQWVDDPAALLPTHVVSWDGSQWRLRTPAGEQPLGTAPSAADVVRRLGPASGPAPCDAKPCLFVRLPPTRELASALHLGTGGQDALRRVDQEASALYVLAGRIEAEPGRDPQLGYALVLARPATRPRDARPTAGAIPLRTRFELLASADGAEQAAAGLKERGDRIARVRTWLAYETGGEGADFPYRLVLKKRTPSGLVPVAAGGKVKAGDKLEFWLQADPARLSRDGCEVRFLYVIGIDSEAHITVYFPADKAGVDNRYPVQPEGDEGKPLPAEIHLGTSSTGLQVQAPFGDDTYILITSREPLPSPRQLEQPGVNDRLGRGASRGMISALTERPAATRGGGSLDAPSTWSVERVQITSGSAE